MTAILLYLLKLTHTKETFVNDLDQKQKDIIDGIKNNTLTAEDIKHYIHSNLITQKDIDIMVQYL
jgi:hypothetical protein